MYMGKFLTTSTNRPWITQGLLVSMKVRDKLSKRRARAKDPQIKSELSEKYKRYRNMIVTLLKQSKNNYYSSYFLRNQSNIKKTCDGIRNVINVSKNKNFTPTKLIYNNETKVSSIDIAESLNDCFVHIGSKLNDKIPKSKKTFSFYLSDANNKSIFLKPCTTNEILLLINTMKASKASGHQWFLYKSHYSIFWCINRSIGIYY